MNRTKKEMQIPLGNSLEASDYLSLILEEYHYTKESIIHYTFLLEEALIHWREQFPPETPLLITRQRRGGNVHLEISLKGEKSDPFALEASEDGEEKPMLPLDKMHDKLLGGVGSEFRSAYRRGRNLIHGIFPTQEPEKRLMTRNLVLLMIPIILQTLLNSVASYADAFMLSFLDASAMSAVSLMTSYISIFSLALVAINSSANALLSQLWGKRDREGAAGIAGVTIKTGFTVALVFAAVTFLFPYQIAAFFTDVEEVRVCAVTYLRIIAPSFLFQAIFTILFGAFRIMGKAHVSLRIGVMGCALNVLLNGLLLFGLFGIPSMGVAGAAIATVVSHLFQCAASLIYNRRHSVVKLQLHTSDYVRKKLRPEYFKQLRNITAQVMSWKAANIITVSAYGHLGADVLAAQSMILLLYAMVSSVRDGIGDAAGVLVGASLGRNRLEEAKQKCRRSMQLGTVISAVCSVICFAFAFGMTKMPVDLTDTAKTYLVYMGITYAINLFFAGLNGVMLGGALRVGGDSKAVLVIDTVCMWGVMVPIAVLGTYVFHLPVLLMAMALRADEIVSFPMKYIRYRSNKWVKNLSDGGE